MLTGVKHISKLCLLAFLAATLLLLQACENDINKIRQLSAVQNSDVDTVRGVETIFSDSAHVKFKLIAPILLLHKKDDKVLFRVMPNGVHLISYDRNLVQTGDLTADTGIQRESDSKIEFHKNVVVKNSKGDVFRSDELIWDQTTKMMHSNKAIQITMANGDITNGIGFTSDQNFELWTIDKMTGIFNVDEKDTQQGQIH